MILVIGDTLKMTWGEVLGEGFDGLYQNLDVFEWLYENNFATPGPPPSPELSYEVNNHSVTLNWSIDNSIINPEAWQDPIRLDHGKELQPFEGYRIYKSTDGGKTWGSSNDRLYDYNGNFIGWKPFKQFDLSADGDINHCIYSNDVCEANEARGTSILGPDPLNPRFSLGENSGISYALIDTLVEDGIEYTLSLIHI